MESLSLTRGLITKISICCPYSSLYVLLVQQSRWYVVWLATSNKRDAFEDEKLSVAQQFNLHGNNARLPRGRNLPRPLSLLSSWT